MRSKALLCLLLGAAYVEALPGASSHTPSATPPFDEKNQHIATTGRHAFKAPGPHDVRGPCPGLNAMANHGFIPHSGFATVPEFILGARKLFRIGNDLATILAAYGGALDGVGAGWSIGGSFHLGIGGSHNNYESDNSPLRGDLHQYGSNSRLIMSQFHDLYNLQPDAETANYDIEVMRTFRGKRFQESIEKNPYFYYAPFSGAVVTQAAYAFIYRFMANKSAEFPMGRLDKNTLKSFMSIHGPEDNLKWIPGHERIPDNWYTRNSQDPYNVAYFGQDLSFFAETLPEITVAGCNQGKVNTFTKINITAMSDGKFTEAQVLKQPLCFGIKFALDMTTSLGIVDLVLQELVVPAMNLLGCDTVPALDTTVGKACPGYSFYGGPTGKVAPGAIQN